MAGRDLFEYLRDSIVSGVIGARLIPGSNALGRADRIQLADLRHAYLSDSIGPIVPKVMNVESSAQ